MIYGILILICILLLCGIAIWFAMRFLKKKRKIAEMERNIPEDILEDFNNAEKQMKGGIKEDGTTTSAYQILWNIAKSKREQSRAESIRDASRTEQPIDNGELYPEPNGGQGIQSRTSTEHSEDKQLIRESKPNNIRQLISRIRRRK
jgi:hypothetical protein